MNVEHQVQFLRQLHGTPENVVARGVHAVGHHRQLHPAASSKAGGLLAVQGFRTVPAVIGRGRERKKDLASRTAHTHAFSFLQNIDFQQIGIHKGSRARTHHFIHAQPRSQGDYPVRQMRLHRKNVLGQPFHERQVVRKTAQESHRNMRMRVDQPGHQQGISQIAPDGRHPGRLQLFRRYRFQNLPVPDGHSGLAVHAGLFRPRNQTGGGHQQIARLFLHAAECSVKGRF